MTHPTLNLHNTSTPDLVVVHLDPHQLDLVINGLAHLEATDPDQLTTRDAFTDLRDAQVLGAALRYLRARRDSIGIAITPGTAPCT